MNAQAWIAVAAILLGIIIKLVRDVARLEGEMEAISRVMEKDRREDRRALAHPSRAKRTLIQHFLDTDETK